MLQPIGSKNSWRREPVGQGRKRRFAWIGGETVLHVARESAGCHEGGIEEVPRFVTIFVTQAKQTARTPAFSAF